MVKVLVVILNKNNAQGLRRALGSLVKQTVPICRVFDVLVLDGGSEDESEEVVLEFAKTFKCIEFRVQKVKGGTGPARIEACNYAYERGYDVIIWGDSENVYDANYVAELVRMVVKKGCDVAGGKPVVRGSLWDHAFFWYHAVHLVFPRLWEKHVPGNNKCMRIHLCKEIGYPPSRRAEDYGFTLRMLKTKRRFKYCVDDDAVVTVSLPQRLGDIIKWQLLRARGAAEAAAYVGAVPWDSWVWFLLLLTLLVGLLLSPVAPWGLLLLAPFAILCAYLAFRAPRFIANFSFFKLVGLPVGLLIHSLFSIYTLFEYTSIRSRLSRG